MYGFGNAGQIFYYAILVRLRKYHTCHVAGLDHRTECVKELTTIGANFVMPDITPDPFFSNLIGVTDSKSEVKRVRIITTPTQAKYFRALPFHATQQETIHESYSIFEYQLKLNYELVHELLSFGSSLKVLDPPELVKMVEMELKQTLHLYSADDRIPGANNKKRANVI